MFLQLLSLEEPWTLILDDELANSFISPVTDDIKDDHQLTCKFLCFPRLHSSWIIKRSRKILSICLDPLLDTSCCCICAADEEYERSWEQNEELGLNDIDTSSADAAYESTETTKLP